jgi:hypothetical protein
VRWRRVDNPDVIDQRGRRGGGGFPLPIPTGRAERWGAESGGPGWIHPSSNTSSGSAADTSAFGASTSSETRSSAATLMST